MHVDNMGKSGSSRSEYWENKEVSRGGNGKIRKFDIIFLCR